jgi:chromosome partitioning protein
MQIIAVTNIKGGVGKTTTAVNLSYLCAASGRPTVLWDLDPQGAATHTLCCEPGERVSAKKLVAGKRELPEVVVRSEYDNLDVIPADFSYRNFDVHLSERKRPAERLLKMSRSLRDTYSTLFLDCPPGISLLSENVLRAADAVIVPLVPSPLSVRMLLQLREFIDASGWSDLVLLPFFSMVDRRKSLHHEVIASTREAFPTILTTEVPYSSEIERMSLRRAPIPAYAPKSLAGQIYSVLWREIEGHMGLPRPEAASASATVLPMSQHGNDSVDNPTAAIHKPIRLDLPGTHEENKEGVSENGLGRGGQGGGISSPHGQAAAETGEESVEEGAQGAQGSEARFQARPEARERC